MHFTPYLLGTNASVGVSSLKDNVTFLHHSKKNYNPTLQHLQPIVFKCLARVSLQHQANAPSRSLYLLWHAMLLGDLRQQKEYELLKNIFMQKLSQWDNHQAHKMSLHQLERWMSQLCSHLSIINIRFSDYCWWLPFGLSAPSITIFGQLVGEVYF